MSDPFIGQISAFGFNFSPRSWAFCSGQILAISQNQSVYSLLGTAFGGNGVASFGIPDLRARAPIGSLDMGQPPGLTGFPRGQRQGIQTQQLHLGNLPSHNHTASFTPQGGGAPVTASLQATTDTGGSTTPSSGSYLAKATAPSATGPDKDENIYKDSPSAGSLVDLGGVSVSGGGNTGGTVSIGLTGSNQNFVVQNPINAVNFAIAMLGLYPSRN